MADLFDGGRSDDRGENGGEAMDDQMDDALDRRLRAELLADLGPGENAYATLQSLAPAFARAARVRRAQKILASAAVVLVFVAGTALAASIVSDPAGRMTAADGTGDPAGDGGVVAEGHRTTLEVAVAADDRQPSGSEGGSGPAQSGVGEAATDSVVVAPTDPDGDGDGAEPDPSTTQATGTTAPPATGPTATSTVGSTTQTTPPASSTSLAPNERLVESGCGDVVVRLGGYSSVTLVDTRPDPGYRTDVESSGPGKVDVHFDGSRRSCEVWARYVDGRFRTSADGEGEDDHDDD